MTKTKMHSFLICQSCQHDQFFGTHYVAVFMSAISNFISALGLFLGLVFISFSRTLRSRPTLD